MRPAFGEDAIVAIDGNTGRRSTTKASASALHLAGAFAADVGPVLDETATAEKFNEITVTPKLLARFVLNGCIVIIDVIGIQTGIAEGCIKTKRILNAASDTFRAEVLDFMERKCDSSAPSYWLNANAVHYRRLQAWTENTQHALV